MTIMGYLMFRTVQDLSLMFHMKNSAAKHSSSLVLAQGIRGAKNGPSTPGKSSSTSEHRHPPLCLRTRSWDWLVGLSGWWSMAAAWAKEYFAGERQVPVSVQLSWWFIPSWLNESICLFDMISLFFSFLLSCCLHPRMGRNFLGGWGIMKNSYGRAGFALVKTFWNKGRKKVGGRGS